LGIAQQLEKLIVGATVQRSYWGKHKVLGFVGFGLLAALTTSEAWGQGFAVNRYEPTPGGDVFFSSDFPLYSGNRTVVPRFGIVGDYAYRPLVARRTGQDPQAIIEHMGHLHAQVTVGILNRFDLHLSVPFMLFSTGAGSVGGFSALNAPAVGDIRFGARVRLWGEADKTPFSIHLGAQLFMGFIPYSQPSFGVTDGTARGRGYVLLAGHASIIRWSFMLGVHGRPLVSLGDSEGNAVGTELFTNAALGFTLLNNRLTFGPEFWANTGLTKPFMNTGTSGEVALGVHYLIADVVQVGVGGGLGLFRQAGTPAARGLLQIAYSPADRPVVAAPPRELDTDRDGVLDRDDLCVTVPQGNNPDSHRRGCPRTDQDNDGVFDDEDVCIAEPKGEHPDPARLGCPIGDADHDTVLDNEDACVTTPMGDHPDPDRRGCPDGDQDNDTVLDHQDQCPTVAQGAHPDPARAGCPLPDEDHDTVPDAVDACRTQAGAPNPNPRLNGCPNGVSIANGMLNILTPVFFDTNSDRIQARSFRVLQSVATALQAAPELRKIRIEGHTDDVGDDATNMELSNRRALSVRRWLIDHRIEEGRLEAQGFGETVPLTPVGNLTGRARDRARSQNRRVQFRIIDPAQSTTTTTTTTPP